jgi:hypothetical protein
MKNITPVTIWSNGVSKQASIIIARIVNDDLSTHCSFYYELKEADTVIPPAQQGESPSISVGTRLSHGNISMLGTDYTTWDGSNETAYQFITTTLNLTLLN